MRGIFQIQRTLPQMTVIGIDNGTSGTIASIDHSYVLFKKIPTKKSLQGKAGKVITRIDVDALKSLFPAGSAYAYLERPFTGKFLNAVLPAQRAFEAVLIALEQTGIGYTVIDSKEWQLPVLGAVKGSAALKEASKLRGMQMYPMFADDINRHGDADGLLIAHHFFYGKKNSLQV